MLMLEHELVGRDYVEPYAGGASVALSLLFEDYAAAIHINDLNPGVHAFWGAVISETDRLCEQINSTPVTIEQWHLQREIAGSAEAGSFELGFATFFLNRTNRSGIISGGVIGGKNQEGDWKIDARYNKADLTSRIRKIGRHRSRIRLTNLDAVEFLQKWTEPPEVESFIYLDPPYYVKGRGLYDNFYGPEEHASVAQLVGRLQCPWIVSYDAVPQIMNLYRDWESIRYGLNYSAHTRGQGSEVMFFSPELQPPALMPPEVTAKNIMDLRARAAEATA
ncbi:MAG: DNA adenine methylase [Micrococcales bacterium]|nr:DNA adenine methylase [Micrococcales bacterium]